MPPAATLPSLIGLVIDACRGGETRSLAYPLTRPCEGERARLRDAWPEHALRVISRMPEQAVDIDVATFLGLDLGADGCCNTIAIGEDMRRRLAAAQSKIQALIAEQWSLRAKVRQVAI